MSFSKEQSVLILQICSFHVLEIFSASDSSQAYNQIHGSCLSLYIMIHHIQTIKKKVYVLVIYFCTTNYPNYENSKNLLSQFLWNSQELSCDLAGSSHFGSFTRLQLSQSLTSKETLPSLLTSGGWQDSLLSQS